MKKNKCKQILFLVIGSFFLVSFKYHRNIDDFLVGHWAFEAKENLGLDSSTFSTDGIVRGNPKKAEGIIGDGSLNLDGKGDYLEITKNGEIPKHFQNLEFGSISIWFKARTIPKETSISPLFHYGNSNGCKNLKDASNEGLVIEIAHGKFSEKASGVYFTVYDKSCELPALCFDSHSDAHLEDVKGLIRENEWYHFVAIVGENYNTGFLNGEEIDFRNYNFSNAQASLFFANLISHEKMWIGKAFWDYAQETYFDGLIDDVRIYSVPLNEKEVKLLYSMKK